MVDEKVVPKLTPEVKPKKKPCKNCDGAGFIGEDTQCSECLGGG